MSTDRTKDSAQEFFAEKLSRDFEAQEAKLNHEAAVRLCRVVWNRASPPPSAKNASNGTRSLAKKHSPARKPCSANLRVRCAGRPHQLSVHFDPGKLLITLKNTARAEHETDVVLNIEGYAAESGRDAHVVHNGLVASPDTVFLAELRVLAGMDPPVNPNRKIFLRQKQQPSNAIQLSLRDTQIARNGANHIPLRRPRAAAEWIAGDQR